MPTRLRESSPEEHAKLPERKKQSAMDPTLLAAIDRVKTGKVILLEYDTLDERRNIARQMGRLAARAGISLDIRYPAHESYISFGQGTEPVTKRERTHPGNGRRRKRTDETVV